MKFEIEYITNTGLTRDQNEDSLLIDDLLMSSNSMNAVEYLTIEKEKILCVVADGMGGHAKGEVASKFVLAKLKNNIDKLNDAESLEKVLLTINEDMIKFAEENEEYLNMGTVLAGVLIIDKKLIVFNVGDCRVYENNFGYSNQLTKDHTLVYSLYESGQITFNEILDHPKKNVVTSAFVANKAQSLNQIYIKGINMPSKGIELLICSDGLWESMPESEIEQCFQSETILECLMKKTLSSGANDNFSGIYIKGGA